MGPNGKAKARIHGPYEALWTGKDIRSLAPPISPLNVANRKFTYRWLVLAREPHGLTAKEGKEFDGDAVNR